MLLEFLGMFIENTHSWTIKLTSYLITFGDLGYESMSIITDLLVAININVQYDHAGTHLRNNLHPGAIYSYQSTHVDMERTSGPLDRQ